MAGPILQTQRRESALVGFGAVVLGKHIGADLPHLRNTSKMCSVCVCIKSDCFVYIFPFHWCRFICIDANQDLKINFLFFIAFMVSICIGNNKLLICVRAKPEKSLIYCISLYAN